MIPESSVGPAKAMIDNLSLMVDSSFINVQITATSDSGETDTCTVPVFITDPTDACGLSNTDFDFNNNFSFFPNPSKGQITVVWSNLTLENIEIFDINGRLIVKQDYNRSGNEMNINLSQLSSGIYILKAASNYGTIAKKLIME